MEAASAARPPLRNPLLMVKLCLSVVVAAAYPPTSLSVERVRRRHQPASPSATNLTPLNSLRLSAIQPASTPNLVAASLQARRLAYYLLRVRTPLRKVATGCHRLPQPTTARHRMSDCLASKPSQTSINPPKSNQNMLES